MNKEIFSKKQKEFISVFKNGSLKRINLLEGSVRSGKTYISLVVWSLYVATKPKDAIFFMAGKTLGTLKRNCLDLLESMLGKNVFTYSLSKKEAILFGRKVYLEGANDKRSESKIRGLTLDGAYLDELTLFDEDFFSMLLSRLSKKGAKLIATTNPDNPNHWLNQNYILRKDKLDMLIMKFLIDDNIFLDKKYVENLKKEYTGAFYDRFILGKWKAADGVIYPEFANESEKFIVDEVDKNDIAFATVGVDFGGNKSAHAFVCTGILKGFKGVVVLDEFYLKEKVTSQRLESEFVNFIKRIKKNYNVCDIYCDSAETTLISSFSARAYAEGLCVDVRNAKKGKITQRIQFFNILLSNGAFFIHRKCKNVCSALSEAVWDAASDMRLDDGTVNVDSLDALEYSCEEYMKDIICVLSN
ncbi:MAG: PBSX family phage terminase large subunit [Ruminococcaceae bacterium]|nr:PBSX family phage terminase large subunit [Oscillospiraceae bacterium]